MEGLSALPEPGTAGIGSLEYGGLQNQDWRGSGSNLRDPWDALMQAAFGDSVVARQMKALAALRAGDAQTAHEQTMPIAMDLASFVGNIKPVGGPIRAYHGSPYDFDKFSMDKIGAGEGAQAYGHGLYFAENEAVAKKYRDDLVAMRVGAAQSELAKNSGNVDAAIDAVREKINNLLSLPNHGGDPGRWQRQLQIQEEKLSELARIRSGGGVNLGRMYEVNIHADPEKLLDWDKPAAKQPPVVSDLTRDGLKRAGYLGPNDNGPIQLSRALRAWRMEQGGMAESPIEALIGGRGALLGDTPQEIAARLNERGVPGIKYLDQGSRVAGRGSRNYVVFDDKLIEILRKYGIGGILAGGAGAAGIGSLDESGL